MGQVTTVGKLLLKNAVPSKYTGTVSSLTFDLKGIQKFFDDIAANHAEDYRDIATNLTRLGFEVSTREGSSVGLDDLLSPYDKTKAIADLNQKVKEIEKITKDKGQLQKKKEDLYFSFADQLNKDILQEGLRTNKTLAKVILSGSRGSPTQYRQTVAAPVLVTNAKGEPIVDLPIMSSYAEGLTLPEYLASTYGARQGMVGTKLAIADAGYLSKQLARAALPIKVEEHDCQTTRGIPVSTSDKDSIGAFLVTSVKNHTRNTEITSQILSELEKQEVREIIVRSPITCQSSTHFHHAAVCQLCCGRREKGKLPEIGERVALSAATAMGERLSQGSLNSKHGSSSATKKVELSGFKGVNQMTNIPKSFEHKALLADQDGKITDIKAAAQGGYYIQLNGHDHYIETGLEPIVHKGQIVEAGDVLSKGVPNPAEVVQFKGVGEGRRYYAQALQNVFKNSGMTINRRNFELMARAAVDHVKIDEADGSLGYNPDDIVHYQEVEKIYKPRADSKQVALPEAKGQYLEQPVLHLTIGTKLSTSMLAELKSHGISSVIVNKHPPVFSATMARLLDVPGHEQDWMHQIYSTYLERRFLNAVNEGMTSNLKGPSPIAGLAYAKDFAKHGEDLALPNEVKLQEEPVEKEAEEYNLDESLEKQGRAQDGYLLAFLQPSQAEEIKHWVSNRVPKDIRAEDKRIPKAHVTLLQGIDPSVTKEQLASALTGVKHIDVALGPVNRFDRGKDKGYDVLHSQVHSVDARYVNALLSDKLKDNVAPEFKNYKPHVTLAYVKPNKVTHLDRTTDLGHIRGRITKLVYSKPGIPRIYEEIQLAKLES